VLLHFLQFLNQQQELPQNFASHFSIADGQWLRVLSFDPSNEMLNLISFFGAFASCNVQCHRLDFQSEFLIFSYLLWHIWYYNPVSSS
jgi:hypothetical protein